MNPETIFGLQFALSIFVYALFAKWYAAPWLAGKSLRVALIILIFPHAMRHVGLSFLVPGLVGESLPATFAANAAYGDFVSGLLAILALIALRQSWKLALPLVGLFSVVGTLDLFNALRQAEAIPQLGSAWFIPTFVVPVLLVTHAMVFARLYQHVAKKSPRLAGSPTAITNPGN